MKTNRSECGSAMTPWLGVVAVAAVAGGAVYFLNSKNEAQTRELATLREQVKELESLRAEAKDLPKLRAQARELETVKKDAETVHRLRNEVSQLRGEQKQFAQAQVQVQQLQSALKQQQAQAQELRAQQQQAAQAAPTSPVQTPAAIQAAQLRALQNACIANLKQLDGATQQWALENKLNANSLVNSEAIKEYLKDRILPVCPAGGQYSFGLVRGAPRCSVPGHSI